MLFCRKQTVLWFLTLFCWGNVFVEALKQKLTRNFSFISFVNDVSNTLLSRWQESLIFKYDDNEVYQEFEDDIDNDGWKKKIYDDDSDDDDSGGSEDEVDDDGEYWSKATVKMRTLRPDNEDF